MTNTNESRMRRQNGAITIFVTMILLVLITLAVVTAFSLSTTNLRAVGNVQFRSEAVAAANRAIERLIETNFIAITTTPPSELVSMINADTSGLDPDLAATYEVQLSVPRCVRATVASVNAASSVTLPGFTAAGSWNTTWELEATAFDAASGSQVRVVQGVRLLLSNVNKQARCPD